MDRRQQVVGGGVERRAAVEHAQAETGEQGGHPLAVDDRQAAAYRERRRAFQARIAALDLLAHVGDVEVRDDADLGEQRRGRIGVVGVDVDLERGRVTDHEHRVADPLQLARVPALLEARAGDREVGAVAEGRGGVLGVGDAGRAVMLERRRL